MATILTSKIIADACSAVDAYVTKVNGLNGDLDGIINTLTTQNFNGDASDGYKIFYTSKVKPALTQNLTAASGSLAASIKEMLQSIETQLLNTVDPQLGSNNQNPGAAG